MIEVESKRMCNFEAIFSVFISTNMKYKLTRGTFSIHQPDLGLLILRLSAGGLMLSHGIPKLVKLFDGNPIAFGDPIGFGPEVSLALAVFSEVLCALLIIFGWATRLATIPLIVTMFIAYFIVHGPDSFQSKELSLFYLLVYLVVLLTGAGKYSIDFLTKRRKEQ